MGETPWRVPWRRRREDRIELMEEKIVSLELGAQTLTISTGQSVVYSGDDKNQSAWFVIITELEEK